jgi:hypothetical protein
MPHSKQGVKAQTHWEISKVEEIRKGHKIASKDISELSLLEGLYYVDIYQTEFQFQSI